MNKMQNKALVIIDIQNDITKNYKDVIDTINKAIEWAVNLGIHVVYIRHEFLSETMKRFKPNTFGSEFVQDLKIVSDNVFTKHKGSACSSEGFMEFVSKNEVCDFYLAGADAVACVKATCNGLLRAKYSVHVLSDCVTSYDKKKIDEMLRYYEKKGCRILSFDELAAGFVKA